MSTIVTLAMRTALAQKLGIDPTDSTQWPGLEGTLVALEMGEGEILPPSGEVFTDEATAEIFKPLLDARNAAIAAANVGADNDAAKDEEKKDTGSEDKSTENDAGDGSGTGEGTDGSKTE